MTSAVPEQELLEEAGAPMPDTHHYTATAPSNNLNGLNPAPNNASQQPQVRLQPANRLDNMHLDSAGNRTCRRLAVFGIALAITGVFSVFIGSVASVLEAEKTYHMHSFVNTHWVSTLFLFAGVSNWLLERHRLDFLLYVSTSTCLVSLPIALGTAFSDCMNLNLLTHGQWPAASTDARQWQYLSSVQLVAMIVYSASDLINSLCATAFTIMLLRELSRLSVKYYETEVSYKSRVLLVYGVCISLIAAVRVVLWGTEMSWVRDLGDKSRFMFLHYTIDEPVWQSVFVMAGLLNMYVAARGSRVCMAAAVALTALGLYPAFLYLWLDYRWYSNVKMSELTVTMPKQNDVLLVNIWLGVLHLFAIVATLIEQVRLLAARRTKTALLPFSVHLDSQLSRALRISGLLFIMAASAFLFSDVVNLLSQSFFRVFYPTEQKLPLQLYAVGVLCLLLLKQSVSAYFLCITFVAVLSVMHTSVFHVTAYLYLTHHTYFHENLCELFYFGAQGCDKQLSTIGVFSHFFEASMAVFVFALAAYVLTVVVRLLKLHAIRTGVLTLNELKRKQRCESLILGIAWAQLLCGVVVLGLSLNVNNLVSSQASHPLLVIHSVIYRSCLSLSLIIYPVAQICFAKQLLFYPLRNLAICCMSMFRFVEILTQLDYRNIGQNSGLAWSAYSAVEVVSLGAHYTTVICCAMLLHIGCSRPRYDFADLHDRVTYTDATQDNGAGTPATTDQAPGHQPYTDNDTLPNDHVNM